MWNDAHEEPDFYPSGPNYAPDELAASRNGREPCSVCGDRGEMMRPLDQHRWIMRGRDPQTEPELYPCLECQ